MREKVGHRSHRTMTSSPKGLYFLSKHLNKKPNLCYKIKLKLYVSSPTGENPTLLTCDL